MLLEGSADRKPQHCTHGPGEGHGEDHRAQGECVVAVGRPGFGGWLFGCGHGDQNRPECGLSRDADSHGVGNLVRQLDVLWSAGALESHVAGLRGEHGDLRPDLDPLVRQGVQSLRH